MTSETDAEFLDRMEHVTSWREVDDKSERDRLFAPARRGAAVENHGQVEKLSEELERVKREAERAQDAHGVRFLNYLEETARLTDEIERLRAEVKVWQGHTKTAVWSDSEECKLLTADNEALCAEIERLRAALEVCDRVLHFDLRGMITWGKDYNQAVKDAADAARAALEERP